MTKIEELLVGLDTAADAYAGARDAYAGMRDAYAAGECDAEADYAAAEYDAEAAYAVLLHDLACAQVDWEVACAAACYAEDLDDADERRDTAHAAAEAAYEAELKKIQKETTNAERMD